MFIDHVKLYVKGGQGGRGCLSFRREKFIPFGGPDGGNGGRGGSVYLIVDNQMGTLLDFTRRPHIRAGNGARGGPARKAGASGEDIIVRVPAGTLIFKEGHLFADLSKPGQQVLVAHGGKGGRGNAAFKTSRQTAPRISEKGAPGEEMLLELELRLIGDVGLVGFPNAGKSTLLSRLSSARPKIADYPFTTLVPNLGVVQFNENSFILADIPGLIEGASRGRGLGDEFLRHIERTRVLIFVLDAMGFEEKDILKSMRILEKELSSYSRVLAKKPRLVVVNKMDLTGAEDIFHSFKKKVKKWKVLSISAVTGKGLSKLLSETVFLLKSAPPAELKIPQPPGPLRIVLKGDFSVEKEGDVFHIHGEKVERLVAMTDFSQEEAVQRTANILKKMGVDTALKKKGVMEGDKVLVGQQEFSYTDDVFGGGL